MKKIPLAFIAGFFAACALNPVSPSQAVGTIAHGLTAVVDIDLYRGQIAYMCETQPRQYCDTSGSCTTEIDRYISDHQCPTTPIE